MSPARVIPAILLATLAALAAVGCAGAARQSEAPRAPGRTVGPDPIVSAGTLGVPDGLEARWWVVRDDPDALRAALAPYLDRPVPADGETVDRLRRAGLRLVAVPLADLLTLRASLPLVGRIDRRWLGQPTEWLDAADGAPRPAGAPVRLDDERLDLPAGWMRLLVRAWAEVGAPSLRLDLALQHLQASRAPRAIALDAPTARPRPAEEGLVFRASLAELSLPLNEVLLLIPASPEFAWAPPDEDAGTGASGSPGGADADAATSGEPAEWIPEPTVDDAIVQGPPAAPVPTLGEALLVMPGDPAGGPRYRAIVALVPRLARTRTLLP